MKRAIEWVDELFYCWSGDKIRVSEVADLVLAVRSEALDAAELLVRKLIVPERAQDVRIALESAAEDIALLGRKAK